MALDGSRAAVPTDQDIYDRIFAAVLDRRLQPGAHLREVDLAQMFGVSRTKVRQAIAKLIQVGVVETRSNRGVAVASPSRVQARQIFGLRRLLEPAIAAELARHRAPAQIEKLRRHLSLEEKARNDRDEAALIRHTGEFHLLLAQMIGNSLMDRMLKELEALTCLAILSFARSETCACLPHEHNEILDAIAAGDEGRAAKSMASHLDHVLAELNLSERSASTQNLSVALGFSDLQSATAGKRRP
jgi:DNA-binding GntR family transcriptional regulator